MKNQNNEKCSFDIKTGSTVELNRQVPLFNSDQVLVEKKDFINVDIVIATEENNHTFYEFLDGDLYCIIPGFFIEKIDGVKVKKVMPSLKDRTNLIFTSKKILRSMQSQLIETNEAPKSNTKSKKKSKKKSKQEKEVSSDLSPLLEELKQFIKDVPPLPPTDFIGNPIDIQSSIMLGDTDGDSYRLMKSDFDEEQMNEEAMRYESLDPGPDKTLS